MKTHISNNYIRYGLLALICAVIFFWYPFINWYLNTIIHEISGAIYSKNMAFLTSEHFNFLMREGKFLGTILNPFDTQNHVYLDMYFVGTYLIFICLAVISIKYLLRDDASSYLAFRHFGFRDVFGSTGIIVALSWVLTFLYIHNANTPSIESQTGISISNPYLWIRFGILFPVIEEVLMRGFLYQLTVNILKNKTGHMLSTNTIALIAIVFQTLVWVLSHTQYSGWAFIAVAQIGLTLGFIRYRTNSLYPCILFHGVFNVINVSLGL